MKILMTGFNPFGGEKINPSFEAVKLLPEKINGAVIVKKELPTEFIRARRILKETLQAEDPDLVICTGQAGNDSSIHLEKVAINYMDARIPDNAGYDPRALPVSFGGETAYFAALPVEKLAEKMKENGIPAYVSLTAGDYVCNTVFYTLMEYIAAQQKSGGKTIRGGFIHVPYLPEQLEGKRPGLGAMPLEEIAHALESVIRELTAQESL